jgi:hypothetical protein
MSDVNETVVRYITAWTERDPERRRDLTSPNLDRRRQQYGPHCILSLGLSLGAPLDRAHKAPAQCRRVDLGADRVRRCGQDSTRRRHRGGRRPGLGGRRTQLLRLANLGSGANCCGRGRPFACAGCRRASPMGVEPQRLWRSAPMACGSGRGWWRHEKRPCAPSTTAASSPPAGSRRFTPLSLVPNGHTSIRCASYAIASSKNGATA